MGQDSSFLAVKGCLPLNGVAAKRTFHCNVIFRFFLTEVNFHNQARLDDASFSHQAQKE